MSLYWLCFFCYFALIRLPKYRKCGGRPTICSLNPICMYVHACVYCVGTNTAAIIITPTLFHLKERLEANHSMDHTFFIRKEYPSTRVILFFGMIHLFLIHKICSKDTHVHSIILLREPFNNFFQKFSIQFFNCIMYILVLAHIDVIA